MSINAFSLFPPACSAVYLGFVRIVIRSAKHSFYTSTPCIAFYIHPLEYRLVVDDLFSIDSVYVLYVIIPETKMFGNHSISYYTAVRECMFNSLGPDFLPE